MNGFMLIVALQMFGLGCVIYWLMSDYLENKRAKLERKLDPTRKGEHLNK